MERHRTLHSRLRARRAVLTRTARTFNHVYVAIAAQRSRPINPAFPTILLITPSRHKHRRARVIVALHHRAFSRVLRNEVVLAHAIRKPRHTSALIRVDRNTRLDVRLRARRAVLTRTARAFVHVYVAVSV